MIYVDTARVRYGRMLMCHVFADSTAELIAAVESVGVPRRHLQHAGTYREHVDVCWSRRRRLLALGAVVLTRREVGYFLHRRRDAGPTTGRD